MQKARFISIEGTDGAGKSSAISCVKVHLESKGINCIVTREPGGTYLGSKLRELILDPDGGKIDDMAELLMIQAARAQHIAEVIKPALKRGTTVISDRYVDSTYAYQGTRGISSALLDQTTKIATGGLMPDLTLFLDIDPAIAMQRAIGRADLDRIEKEGLEFQYDVKNGFLKRIEEDPKRFSLVDAAATFDDVNDEIRFYLNQRLKQWDLESDSEHALGY